MNIKLDSASLKGIVSGHMAGVLWLALLVLIVFEAFVVNRSVSVISAVRNQPPPPLPNRSVRVDFAAYDQVVKRIEAENTDHSAVSPVERNPFGASQPGE